MKIVINHLTRMRGHRICVAGIDIESNEHVRPVIGMRRQLTTDLLYENNGVFALGNVVDFGDTLPVGSKPEIEDYEFHEDRVSVVNKMGNDEYWSILENNSKNDLWDIFGDDLVWNRNERLVTKTNCGNVSLGLWELSNAVKLYQYYGKIWLKTEDNIIRLTVADIRLHEQPNWEPKYGLIEKLNQKIEYSEKIILSVGLTRPYAPPDTSIRFHWLQINNLHFVENPLDPWE